jgi:hypothetical protein
MGWSVQLSASTGAPSAPSINVIGGDGDVNGITMAPSTRMYDSMGHFALAGGNIYTTVVRYFLNYNTASPVEIVPALLAPGDAWVAKVAPAPTTGAPAVRWAYRVEGTGASRIAGTFTLGGGDVVVAGWTPNDELRLHHGTGSDVLTTGSGGTGLNAGWLARYAESGSSVRWKNAVRGAQATTLAAPMADEEANALYVVGGGRGLVSFDRSEPGGQVIDLGAPSVISRYIARLDLNTGRFQWATRLATLHSATVWHVAKRGLCELVAYVAYAEDVTFDPGGPNELTLTAPGQIGHGLARFTTDGRFLGYSEVGRLDDPTQFGTIHLSDLR